MTDWDLRQVGFLEMGLVLHCGGSTAEEYAHSLSALEIGSAWWEGEAVMGRAQSRIFEAIKKIRTRTRPPGHPFRTGADARAGPGGTGPP